MNHVPAEPTRSRSGFAFVLALAPLLFFTLGAGTAQAASGQLGPPILGLRWSTFPEEPCGTGPVRLLFSVCECKVDLHYAARGDSLEPIHVLLNVNPDLYCVRCVPETLGVDLGVLAPGTHSFAVRVGIEYVANPDTTWPPSPVYDVVTFQVFPTCGTPGPIPYLSQVVIEQGAPCATCPARVCPGDSVDVVLRGSFPDTCHELLGVELKPNPSASPLPLPPIVQLHYGDRSACTVCALNPVPWEAHVRLPEQPYIGGLVLPLTVEADIADLCLPVPLPEFAGRADFPFYVAESCSTGPGRPCFNVAWSGADSSVTRCDATWSKEHPAELVFGVGSTVPVNGVQGTLTLDTDALAVTAIFSARDGWVVQWSPQPDGSARFVAFAGTGAAAIPGDPSGRPQDLLRVRVASSALRVGGPDRAMLAAVNLLVSDAQGQAIPMCPVLAAVVPPPWVAILCREALCDANGDALADVRDLVLMVNCLDPPPNVRLDCPVASLDCDGNGSFGLDDVFCCAVHMLGGPVPVPTPDSLRQAPDITARFGLPRAVEEGAIEVPLLLSGLNGVAAARLEARYPESRYEVVGVDFAGASSSWWTLHQAEAGRLALLLLQLGGATDEPVPAFQGPIEATLRLRLRPGTTAGGELTLSGHDFAAPDGVTLTTPNVGGSVALGALDQVVLTAPRPNPFAAGTTFALTLPVAGTVDVGVFDVAGRRVATLMQESAAAAGVYPLRWNGSDTARGRAAGGVYFVRVVTGAGEIARKVLFLPGAGR